MIDKKRTQILTEKFFSTLSIIEPVHNVCNLAINSMLRLNNHISVKEILKIINRLSSRKTAELNRILNEVLKYITLKIYINMTYKICMTFIYSLLLKYFKKLIIIILHKESKKNYLLSVSYRLIALKNMLTKIMKKILVTYLSCTAEKYSLLF